MLVLGANLLVMFIGWEGVGLCSYLLIGFWFTEEQNASAGKKAFIVNRIGDFGLLLATVMLVWYCGSLKWEGIAGNASNLQTAVKVWPIGNLPLEGEWLQRAGSSPWPAFLAKAVLPEKPVMVYASTLVWPSSWAAPARARRSRSTSGCPTRWPVRPPSRRSYTRPPW